MTHIASRSFATLAAILLLAAGLAGCIGSEGDASGFASLEDAKAQSHTTAEPTDASTLRLGLIEPATVDGVSQGITNVTFVLWDAGNGDPVTGAEVTVDAFMPAMGHGTDPEEDPVHEAHGVYRGSTNLMMGGEWVLKINVTRDTGSIAHFELPVTVTGGGGHGDMDHGHSTSYGSYEEAKGAEGPTFEPQEDSTYRLKLLDPAQTTGLEQGELNVTVLVFDSEADEPVTSGNATLNATMPAMGHGTSPETDPVHAEHGVWKGSTNLVMNGTWILNVDVKPDGEAWHHWSVNVSVGEGSMDHGNHSKPAFEPYTEVFEDDVSSADYTETYNATVKGANATITMNATLEDASLLDNITVTLFDPEGGELGSISLDSDTNSSQLVVDEAPVEGEYEIEVHGQAVGSSYVVEFHVAPP